MTKRQNMENSSSKSTSTKYVYIDPFINLTYDQRKAVQQLEMVAANFRLCGFLIIHKLLHVLMINFRYLKNTVNKHSSFGSDCLTALREERVSRHCLWYVFVVIAHYVSTSLGR